MAKYVAPKQDFSVLSPFPLRSKSPKQNKFLNFIFDSLPESLRDLAGKAQHLQPLHSLIFQLQFIYGLRASEALNITHSDISGTGLVLIRAGKQSHNRIIFAPDLLPLHSLASADKDKRIFPLSYRQYYLALKRAGINYHIHGTSRRASVTHAARHAVFQHVSELFSLEVPETMRFSGHKTQSGLNYYLGANSLSGNTGACNQ